MSKSAALEIAIRPATLDRWPDVQAIMAGQGDRGCWCQYWRASASAYGRLGPGGGARALHDQLGGQIPPGLLAYADGVPAGWCGLGPRSAMERLVRSRTIPLVDDLPVWSIVCFLVRPGFRRRGVARALLEGAIVAAREGGAPALEAYPVDPGGGRVDAGFGYVGFVPMFRDAGFHSVVETAARSDGRPRILMRHDLGRDGKG